MAQAEGTSKNEGRVSSSTSGASKGSNSSRSSNSSRNEKDDGRPTSAGIADAKSRNSSFSSGGGSGWGQRSNTGSSKSGKSGSAASIGEALGSLLGGGIGGAIGGFAGKSAGNIFGSTKSSIKSPQDAVDAVTGKTVAESKSSKKTAETARSRDFSGLGNRYGAIANTLADAGWTNSMIAGYLGSIQQESGGNTRARNKGDAADGTDSVGQGQWNMDRLTNLERFSKNNNLAWDDNVTQTKFTVHELATTHKHVSNKLAAAADDPEEYAGIFGKNYEVSKQIPERKAYARQFANKMSELGIPDVEKAFNKVDDFVASLENINKPASERPIAKAADPFGIGTFISNTLGIQNPGVGPQNDGSYVDPRVSTVSERQRRGDSSAPSPTKGRSGVGGMIEKGQKGQPLGVANEAVKAIRDPIGFAIDTIVDIGNQSKFMNTPGAEGEGGDLSQQEFGLGFLKSFLGGGGGGSAGGFGPSEKNGNKSIADQQPAVTLPTVNPVPVTPVTPVATAPTTRKPFQWSTISGTLDDILGTSYSGGSSSNGMTYDG